MLYIINCVDLCIYQMAFYLYKMLTSSVLWYRHDFDFVCEYIKVNIFRLLPHHSTGKEIIAYNLL